MIKVAKKMSSSVMLAGIIILMISLYYGMFKAGIPYQDPPLDLQIEYAINSGIGSRLFLVGGVMAVLGLFVFIINKLAEKVMKKQPDDK